MTILITIEDLLEMIKAVKEPRRRHQVIELSLTYDAERNTHWLFLKNPRTAKSYRRSCLSPTDIEIMKMAAEAMNEEGVDD